MTEHEASRTLVKSPPELWAECSDGASLARHLGAFGEISVTRLEPERTVAWEGAHVSGTVRLEPSGWGTRVILTAARGPQETGAPEERAAVDEPPEADVLEPEAKEPGFDVPPRARRPGLLGRLLGLLLPAPAPAPATPPARKPPLSTARKPPARPARKPPAPAATAPSVDPGAVLAAALDSLGRAHHRPFSRG